MRQRARGSIVNIASNLVEHPVVPYHDYTTAKASLVAFSRNLASELGPVGIRVNCVAPGLVYPTQGTQDTRESFRESLMAATPLRRLASPEDVAGAVVFLASELSGFIWGELLVFDGGQVMRWARSINCPPPPPARVPWWGWGAVVSPPSTPTPA